MEIKVLGPGCANCTRLEQEVMQVLTEMELAANIEHVTDIQKIASYGVLGTPALIINGKVKSVGNVPSRDKIAEWLREARE